MKIPRWVGIATEHTPARRPMVAYTSSQKSGQFLWWGAQISLWLAGARAIRVRPQDGLSVFERVDGVVLGGGDDIGAELYGGKPIPNVRIDPDRDRMELQALEIITRRQRPILGICRGSQMLNIFLGGTLHEDIYKIYVDARRMRTVLPRKKISVASHTLLAKILQTTSIQINSLHHQSIDRPGDGLRIAASDASGMVQAVERTSRPWTIGVQWHPELLFYRQHHRNLFKSFVQATTC